MELIAQVREVLNEYRDYLPVTARQIFYRLVGEYGFEKTEKAYNRLTNHLTRARRAKIISFADMRDDGTIDSIPLTYEGVDSFWEETQERLDAYSRDRLAGQDVRIELWCEAAGMVPQLYRVASPYSIPVYSTGGFSSVTVTHEISQRALKLEQPTVFLHVGDYDPSGESIYTAMSDDAEKFVLQTRLSELNKDQATYKELRALDGPQLRAERVALTEEQVDEHSLPTAPPKESDTRTRNWVGETCQLEALPPDALAEIVNTAIQEHIDMDRYREEVAKEEADREEIHKHLTERPA